MIGLDVIQDPHVILAAVRPVEPAGVLLQRSLPGYRHGQNEGVQWRVIESLTD